MFSINTGIKGYQRPLQNWFIVVNGQKCRCNKTIAIKISPIIQDFYQNEKNEDLFFATEILINQTLTDPSENSESSLNSICKMISILFCGEEIVFQEDNSENLYLIGKHFKIQEVINKIEEYQKHLKIFSSHLKDNTDFKEMIELEKMLLFEINETNVEAKVTEYESLIKKIPISCFIHFVINICTKNYNITKTNSNEFVIEIIKNVDKIVPETLQHFLSIIFHKFIFNNSKIINDIDKFDKKEINSLIHQTFVDGLIENIDENIKLNQNEIIIPEDLQKYFNRKGNFFELIKENNTTNNSREAKDQFLYIIESIENDNIDSFQNYIFSLKIDINRKIKNNINNQIYFIKEEEECSLIELLAFFGSMKCFTYLFNQKAKINKNRLSYFAVAGGNPEIIHICEREDCVFNDKSLAISIKYHKHQITKWLIDTKKITVNERNLRNCIIYYNIKTIRYLFKKGINIDKMMIFICESNNIILFKWLNVLLENYEMKMIYKEKNKTLLHIACEHDNDEIVKFLILRDEIDINSIFKVIILNGKIINYVIKLFSKSSKSFLIML